ncbi:hypothetical protein BU24DRAFT_436494 [Aaosphaeria arxii CBS 175.79]|uniref:rRNA-processing protein FYV7 n=1 Tax=Aaosphaeria arxii CBS 175.79 TaxID=1450172 RepID=A0A6A5XB76_9PLEO|nr:uncharacterized protein BU24DRAFT_436494 [Aaosphaeria arxii CBS 175.79]KAF2010325.1 hypothetical protein BU24DRAFT_436494 [Aaosphaeria arxii CBS 175.79]
MAPKRSREDDTSGSHHVKKRSKGFSIGPANLPDGTHKRKLQKIKKDIIEKAKLKKEYAKLKAREQPDTQQKTVYEREDEREKVHDDDQAPESAPEPTLELHPDRVKLLDEKSPSPGPDTNLGDRRRKRARPQTYKRETELAQKRKEEADARQRAREAAEKERTKKIAERERFHKTMAKARAGGPGKRKLGKESTVLLEKVKRLVGNA